MRPDWRTVARAREILGVPARFTSANVRASFRRLALATHPDKCPGDAAAAEKFSRLKEAADTLYESLNYKRGAAAGTSSKQAAAARPAPSAAVPREAAGAAPAPQQSFEARHANLVRRCAAAIKARDYPTAALVMRAMDSVCIACLFSGDTATHARLLAETTRQFALVGKLFAVV